MVGWQACGAVPVPAIDLDPATLTLNEFALQGTNGMYGWSFFLKQPMTVTGIGWYDEGRDGLAHPHEVGIWQDRSGVMRLPYIDQSTSVLLQTTTVPAGVGAPLDGPWRRVDFNVALTLQPGGYEIADTYQDNPEDVVKFALDRGATLGLTNSLPTDPRMLTGLAYYSRGGAFQAPALDFLVAGVELGPMLFIEPIPEPPSLALGLAGLAMLMLRRVRFGRLS